jgi:tRNA threonylcarbamoyl adenosine modification protein YjeE
MIAARALPDIATTEKFAAEIAPHLRVGDVLALLGDLGAGKTTFARALLRALGITGEVPSPTFSLVQSYDTSHFVVNHYDLYRLKNETELEELDWDDAMASGVMVVEWPERAARYMPDDRLDLHFVIESDGSRHCTIRPQGQWRQRWETIP